MRRRNKHACPRRCCRRGRACRHRSPADFIAERSGNGDKPHQQYAAARALGDLTDGLRQRRSGRVGLRDSLEAARSEDRHIVLASRLHIVSKLLQDLNQNFPLMVALGENLLASIQGRCDQRVVPIQSRLQSRHIDGRLGVSRIVVHSGVNGAAKRVKIGRHQLSEGERRFDRLHFCFLSHRAPLFLRESRPVRLMVNGIPGAWIR